MVARATSVLPSCVSAGTGFVGLRRPAHAVAQALLEEAGVPVAAPSANRFGHVSPTSAAHVVADLGDRSVTVLDVDADNACVQRGGTPCRAQEAAGLSQQPPSLPQQTVRSGH